MRRFSVVNYAGGRLDVARKEKEKKRMNGIHSKEMIYLGKYLDQETSVSISSSVKILLRIENSRKSLAEILIGYSRFLFLAT